jgi:hypothetical protein
LPTADPAANRYVPGGGGFDFAFPILKDFWNQTGSSPLWGISPNTRLIPEHYQEDDDKHLVQYFDKGRMEWSSSPDLETPVTSGLLASELLSGYIQMGGNSYAKSCSPNIPMFGDDGPTYASFAKFADTVLVHTATQDHRNSYANIQLMDNDTATEDPNKVRDYGNQIQIVLYTKDSEHARHNVPRIFCDFLVDLRSPGLTCAGQAVPKEFWDVSGFPISEPYWTSVVIDSSYPEDVMFQAFERRVLLYRPQKPAGQAVVVTNIGQHYFEWRYRMPQKSDCQ